MIHLKQKSAFTLIELIFVIVVLGIIASIALPRLDAEKRQAAADDILSQIRYTQHLALMDDMHEFNNPKWQQKFLRIDFGTCDDNSGLYFRIGSDTNTSGGGFDQTESASDPLNGKALFATNYTCNYTSPPNNNVLLGKKYGVQSITSSGGCNNVQHIGFDHLGRPHISFSNSPEPNYDSYMTSTCNFKFTMLDGDDFNVSIAPETGYAQIIGQDAS